MQPGKSSRTTGQLSGSIRAGIEPDNWPVVRLDFPGCISSPMGKRVPTKTIWEAVGSWFPSLRMRFFTRDLRTLASHALEIDHVRVMQLVAGPES
jgi:hypothetical protein